MADYRQYFQVVLRQPSAQVTEEFFTQSGRYSNFQKETYFLRYLCRDDRDSLLERCRRWEQDGRGAPRGCVLVPSLQRQPDQEALGRYLALCRDGQWQLPFHFENWILEEALQDGFREILGLFQESRGRAEPSILRNFAVKILFWMDQYFPRLFEETRRIASFPKFVCGGQVKLAEYLFLYLLYRMGCDVLYVGREQDVSVQDPALLGLSVVVQGPVRRQEPVPVPAASRGEGARPVLRSPQRPVKVQPPRRETPPARQRQPLEYVELARLAASVVMLQVFDAKGECFKTGSGVIINESGYLLTNFHVVAGGRYYGVLLEEEEDVCYTDELIKYNQDLDLAILRMEKRRKPIPVRRDLPQLVRGEKVVAIGSPLGLFNTVSDGIISAFRTVGERSMIQFTAPTSHGSSGGALLDLYGNLIGIITAGFDDGQNLNLAVDYKTILEFARGLL